MDEFENARREGQSIETCARELAQKGDFKDARLKFIEAERFYKDTGMNWDEIRCGMIAVSYGYVVNGE